MPFITTKDGAQIFYKDWGTSQPVVFSHGWPLSADDWDPQMLFFLNKGFRVIAHDRRGHGRSSQTGDGHATDHYADDLAAQHEPRRGGRVVNDHDVERIAVLGSGRRDEAPVVGIRQAEHQRLGQNEGLEFGIERQLRPCSARRLDHHVD